MKVVVVALLAILGSSSCARTHAQTSGSQGVGTVGFETRELADENRRNWQNTAPRPLSTVIWYPAPIGSRMDEPAVGDPAWRPYFVPRPYAVGAPVAAASARYPLVVLSHGSTSVNLSLGWLGAYLASRGYIAAAVNHHGNTGAEGVLLPQGFVLSWERAVDVSALIDRLLADPKFGPHIDPQRIAAAGHSAGGATMIMLAGGQFSGAEIGKFCSSPRADSGCEPRALIERAIAEVTAMRARDPVVDASFARATRSLRDHRIRSVLAMAPAVGPAFTASTLGAIKVPVFVATAKIDPITPADTNAHWYASQIPGARLWVVPGNAGHMTFGSECTDEGKRALEVCRDGTGLDRGSVHAELARTAFAFFEEHWPK